MGDHHLRVQRGRLLGHKLASSQAHGIMGWQTPQAHRLMGHELTGSWAHRFGSQAHKLMSSQVDRLTGWRTRRRMGSQAHGLTGSHAQRLGSWTHSLIGSQAQGFTGSWVHRRTESNLLQMHKLYHFIFWKFDQIIKKKVICYRCISYIISSSESLINL